MTGSGSKVKSDWSALAMVVSAVVGAVGAVVAAVVAARLNLIKPTDNQVEKIYERFAAEHRDQIKALQSEMLAKAGLIDDLRQQVSDTAIKLQLCEAKPEKAAVCPPGEAGMSTMDSSAASVAATSAAGPSAGSLANSLVGKWQGEYRAGEGVMGMTLTVKRNADQDLAGEVHFYPVAENLRAKEGRFLAGINANPATGVITFRGTRWIDQPPGFKFLTNVGTLSSDGRTFEGIADSMDNFKFKLVKQ